MKEKDFYPLFRKINKLEGAFELKLCKGKSIAFNSVKPHQIKALLEVNGTGFTYHINDAPFTMKFTKLKPFDFFTMKNYPAFVVIIWWEPFKKKEFHYIAIQDFLAAKKQSTRKSLTEFVSAKLASKIERT